MPVNTHVSERGSAAFGGYFSSRQTYPRGGGGAFMTPNTVWKTVALARIDDCDCVRFCALIGT